MQNWLIVTDLDGTLLDDNYAVDEAARALDKVSETHTSVHVVLASSKTLAEMQSLADAVTQPLFLIFENGAGVAWRDGTLIRSGQTEIAGYQVVKFCTGYREVCDILALHRGLGYPFQGFSQMTDAEVAQRTGLPIGAAAQARARLLSEPIVWHGDDVLLKQFTRSLAEHGLTLQSGGRFYHVSSGANKATALSYLTGQLRYELGIQPTVLACGDAPNDLELLDKADHALVFPQRSGDYIRQSQDHVWHAPQAGPKHWLNGVQQILVSQGECA